MATNDRSDRAPAAPTTLAAPAPATPPPEDIQRWTAGRKAGVVLDLIKGRTTAAEVARQFNLTVAEIEGWVERFTEGGRENLRAVPRDVEARHDAERKDLLAKVGELTLQVDALKKKTSSASTLLDASGRAPNW